ncbi:MAG: hypothetical protein RLZZ350_2391, partial [Verrucomicrobiota bacterium]
MKRLKQIFLTALVAGATQLASALSYNANDVLLVFRQSGSSDVEFNVGSVNNFLDQPAGTPISVSFNSDYVYTNNGSSFTNVKFDAVAATTSAASQPRVWLTDANLAAMPADFTVSKFSVVRGKIDAVGVQNGAITGSTNMPLVISPTAVGSYSYIVSPGNPTAVGTFGGDVPFTVDATSGNSLAFYQVVASAASPKPSAIKVGTFDFNSTSGAVTFTPVAVSPVFTAPTLSLQGGTQNAGSSKTFSVTADGTCSFQWYLNGTAIGGATSSSLTIASPQLANAGAYTCVASNCTYGTTTTSALAQLNVLDVPSITTQPANAAVARGASATFTVTANNNYAGTGVAPVLGYQWYFNGAVIVNATNASVTIASISHANIGNYSVVVSSAAGSVTSSAATLRFTSATAYLPGDLQLIFRKSGFNNAEINLGSISNYLNLTSGAVVPVAYDTNTVYTNFSSSLASVKFTLAAANSSTLWLSDANLSAVPSDVTLSKFSALRGKVDNAGIQASAITLGANPLLIAGNAVAAWDSIVSPGNSTAVSTLGGDSVFTVEAANSNSVALYQIVASAATPKPAAIKIGTFTYNTDGSVTFTASAVTPVLTSAALSAQAATLNAGVSKTFSVTADGACSFQWYLGGVAIGGATSASYTIASPTSTDAGSYTVVASNCVYGTTTTSSAAQLNVISAPSITTQPAATTVARGGSATLTVVANDGYTGTGGAPTLTYQWYFNGV